jgi:multiple antibiotic resistance protein
VSGYVVDIGHAFLVIFAALFPIINPPGAALLFLSMTRRISQANRAHLAKLVALYAGIIIVASLSIGGYVLNIFGISIPVLRVAGGIVVSLMGWQMLSAPAEDEEDQPSAKPLNTASGNVAFYPLTMPLTTGPGTIAVCIALGTARPTDAVGSLAIGAVLAVVAIVALIYLCFVYAGRIERLVGKTGSEALSRFFSFILLCIGIQTLWTGLAELWTSLPVK